MITCDSVDFPEPFGPMSACTSPDRTSRSMPRKISCPSTDACRSSMRRTLIVPTVPFWSWDAHDHVVAVDTNLVDGDGLRGGKTLRITREQRERRTVLGALDLALFLPEIALTQREVSVRADVVDRVPIVVDAHDAYRHAIDVEALVRARLHIVHGTHAEVRHSPSQSGRGARSSRSRCGAAVRRVTGAADVR